MTNSTNGAAGGISHRPEKTGKSLSVTEGWGAWCCDPCPVLVHGVTGPGLPIPIPHVVWKHVLSAHTHTNRSDTATQRN